jgi:hypothetical protein
MNPWTSTTTFVVGASCAAQECEGTMHKKMANNANVVLFVIDLVGRNMIPFYRLSGAESNYLEKN